MQGFVPTPWAWSLVDEHRLLVTKLCKERTPFYQECERTARALAEAVLERGAQEEEIAELADRHRHSQSVLSQEDQVRRQAELDWRDTSKKSGEQTVAVKLDES